MYSIEESLDVDLAVKFLHVRINLDESARKLLSVKAFSVKLGGVVEEELV